MTARVVISPAMKAMPVVTSVSHATRHIGSWVRMASRIESEIWSAILSGWPSVTDSDVKRCRPLRLMPDLLFVVWLDVGRVLLDPPELPGPIGPGLHSDV